MKNRTISPVAQLFLDCALGVVKPLQHRNGAAAGSATTRELSNRKQSPARSVRKWRLGGPPFLPTARRLLRLAASVDVVEAHDVVLTEITADLHLD